MLMILGKCQGFFSISVSAPHLSLILIVWATLSSDPGFTTLRLVSMLTPSELVSNGETRSQGGEEVDVTVVTTQDNSGAI